MATLQLYWGQNRVDDLWSWRLGKDHQTARIIRSLTKNVHTAHLGARGMEPTCVVILKTAQGVDELASLSREAELYSGELRHLQSRVVPACYGFFRGKRNGIDLGCLLLEYCNGPAPVWNLSEFNREVMLAVCQIHKAGIVHGNLLDGHHFVKMGDSVRIVDFSLAVRHHCANGLPALTSRENELYGHQCAELVMMERTYGYKSDTGDMRQAQRAYKRFPLWS